MLVDGHNLGFDRLLDLLGVRALEARILGIDDRRQQRFAADLARDHDALVDDVELIQILLQLSGYMFLPLARMMTFFFRPVMNM